jgi:vacuolar-type H+-ATPase subunit C/Vma6
MKVLMDVGDIGYPTEYLMSRIRGRRVSLIKDLRAILISPDILEQLISSSYGELIAGSGEDGHPRRPAEAGIQRYLLREYRWAYIQMNKELRSIFIPFFIFFEIKTLIICLRYKIKKGGGGAERVLSQSLLSERIRKLLNTGTDLLPVLEEIASALTPSSLRPSLGQVYSKNGLQGVEEELYVSFLERAVRSQLHPVIMKFFRSVVDYRNIIHTYKRLKWGLRSEPLFVSGGCIKRSRLRKLLDKKELSGIAEIVYKFSGKTIEEPFGSFLESALKTALTRKTELMIWDDPEIGLILNYLWRRYIEAENLNVLLYGRDIDRDVIRKELVN